LPAGWSVGVTGADALAVGDSSDNGAGVVAETIIGVVGALLVLSFVFASFLAVLPLVVVVVVAAASASILLSFVLLLPVTYATDVSFQFLISLIGLGVAIDYSLLLVNRWREERAQGRGNHEAVLVAMETAGRAVAFSGVTVAIGLVALVVLPVPFVRSIGLGGAPVLLARVITTLTLTAAILGGIGPRVDWPRIRRVGNASRAWTAWARTVVRHRLMAAGFALLLLGGLSASLFGIKIGLVGSQSLAVSSPAYTASHGLTEKGSLRGFSRHSRS